MSVPKISRIWSIFGAPTVNGKTFSPAYFSCIQAYTNQANRKCSQLDQDNSICHCFPHSPMEDFHNVGSHLRLTNNHKP